MALRALSVALVFPEAAALSDVSLGFRPHSARHRGAAQDNSVVEEGSRGHVRRRERPLGRARKAAVEAAAAQDSSSIARLAEPVLCPADPPDEIAGEYEVWHNGVKRNTTMAVGCDNVIHDDASWNSFIYFVNASSTECKRKGDQDATIYVSAGKGHDRHACLYREGSSLKGNRYVGDMSIVGGVEYRLVRAVECPPRKLPPRRASRSLTACNPETRDAALLELTKSFEMRWSAKVAEAFGHPWADSYLLVGDWHSGHLVANWLAYASIAAESNRTTLHVVHVALDQAGVEGCRSFIHGGIGGKRIILRCVSLSGWLSAEHALFSRFDGPAHHGILAGCDSSFTTWTKPVILKAAVEASDHPVMMVEPDVVLYTDLMPLGADLLNHSSYATMVAGLEGSGRADTGTVYATKESLSALSAWARQGNQCLNSKEVDKGALQQLVHNSGDENGTQEACRDAVVGDKCYEMVTWARHTGVQQHPEWYTGLTAQSSRQEFQACLHDLGRDCPKPCGFAKVVLAYFPSSEVGQCQRKGRAATHFNCVDPEMKASLMKSMKHWSPAVAMEPEAILASAEGA